ncbi:Acg family FMN-binding oxidoreductase [Amycolatopsis sp.]|uniref:Acg family FMN-binding oxidoreductase n=1 Tax=Amycolatopsis sp. TaxID=37632 RepID=UPI002C461E26|nr:nitroreductase family protein [Amycolatopsis sp.]HVV14751.1 nitroreductase family protein [Amycolatopsis sp.]
MTSWSATETGVLAGAAARAPSVHHSRPWALEPGDGVVDLVERPDAGPPLHDPTGRDRMISCGAALANLELAVQALGYRPASALFPEPARPGLVARVRTDGRRDATAREVERYSAIFRRRSYRAPFSLHPVPAGALRSLVDAAGAPGAGLRVVHGLAEFTTLADLFGTAAKTLREDRAYQRELVAWTGRFPERFEEVSTPPWTGLVTGRTTVPDRITLTERLRAETMAVLVTEGDTRADHLRAGMALQRGWLAAITDGLAGSVLTQPLRLPEVRAGLVERLRLSGYPQLILRFGYPVTATPATPVAALARPGEG